MSRAPVLLPPAPKTSRPLPPWLGALALVGFALLLTSTVPALMRHARLSHDLRRLERQVAAQEREVRRLDRELTGARGDTFAYARAVRQLLHPAPPRRKAEGAPEGNAPASAR